MKTVHSDIPKKFLEETKRDFSGDTWIVLEKHAKKEDILLVNIGEKYNLNKVLVFISTKWAVSTQPGEPYLAKFSEKYGNVCTREVLWPDIISNYFNKSNVVDLHNQTGQAELALEKNR